MNRAQSGSRFAARCVRPHALAAAVAAAFVSGSAFAHHGFGNFDLNREVTVHGTVKGLDFVNPHSYVYVNVKADDGSIVPYRCEMRAATVLKRSGWSAQMFVPGQDITITGAPDRFDAHSCYVNTIQFADGTKADRYAQLSRPAAAPAATTTSNERPARLPTGEPNLNGDWAPEQVVMTDPKGRKGALVPVSKVGEYKPGEGPTPGAGANARRPRVTFTEAGQKAADAFQNFSQADNPRMRCETTSILFDWTFDGPIDRITQTHDAITLQYGQLGFTRTIRMNAEHPAEITPSRGGDSVGKWDGDTLVVDTVGVAPGVLSPPIMNSDKLHVVERFTLDPATMKITRAYTAEDPVYYTDQYTGSDVIGVADEPYAPDQCKELTFVDFSNDGTGTPSQRPAAAAAGAAARPAANGAAAPPSDAAKPADKPAKSWWKFWEWWD